MPEQELPLKSSEAPAQAAKPSRTLRGEEEIKTKIDLSHISRPGDVLKAITQQKESVAAPPKPSGPPEPASPPKPVFPPPIWLMEGSQSPPFIIIHWFARSRRLLLPCPMTHHPLDTSGVVLVSPVLPPLLKLPLLVPKLPPLLKPDCCANC